MKKLELDGDTKASMESLTDGLATWAYCMAQSRCEGSRQVQRHVLERAPAVLSMGQALATTHLENVTPLRRAAHDARRHVDTVLESAEVLQRAGVDVEAALARLANGDEGEKKPSSDAATTEAKDADLDSTQGEESEKEKNITSNTKMFPDKGT